jgi:hypothetical protein
MLYDRPVRALLAECTASLPGPEFTTDEVVRWFRARYPLVKENTVRMHLLAYSANDPSRRHHAFARTQPAFLFKVGRGRYVAYDPDRDGLYDEYGMPLDGSRSLTPEDPSDAEIFALQGVEPGPDDEASNATFVLERYLEEFLLSNWQHIDWGMPLRLHEGIAGHQFSTPVGRLDFLCRDTTDGAFVAVELKRGQPDDRVIGQAARYMGWLRETLAKEEGVAVRGLIIAESVSDQLKYSASAVPGLHLATYSIAFSLRPTALASTLPQTPASPQPATEPANEVLSAGERSRRFGQAMRDIYLRARDELGYNATYFLSMLSELGAMQTAVRLVGSTTPSAGFTTLWERGRLDLTVEALVLSDEYADLFEDWIVKAALERLEAYGYA